MTKLGRKEKEVEKEEKDGDLLKIGIWWHCHWPEEHGPFGPSKKY